MTVEETGTEAEIIQLIANNDYAAFEIIYERYAASVERFILRILKSKELSADICQEIFIQLWTNRSKLSQVKSFKAYLFASARNRAIDSLKAAIRNEAAMGEVVQNFIIQRNTTDDELLDKEYRLFLDRVLATLPERTRHIFMLCREQNKTYEEVASLLGISRSAVKNHMVHSMKMLGRSVKKDLGISLTILLALAFRQ